MEISATVPYRQNFALYTGYPNTVNNTVIEPILLSTPRGDCWERRHRGSDFHHDGSNHLSADENSIVDYVKECALGCAFINGSFDGIQRLWKHGSIVERDVFSTLGKTMRGFLVGVIAGGLIGFFKWQQTTHPHTKPQSGSRLFSPPGLNYQLR